MIKVAITGSTGLVGSRIQELLYHDVEFLPLLQKDVNITDSQGVKDYLNSIEFDTVLHLAAYTNVDGAEKERDLAHRINVLGTKNLFEVTQKLGKKFIYISTDFVFDGTKAPYDEDSTPHSLGYYGKTKFEGEEIVKDKAMTVRISYPYRKAFPKKPDFVWRIKELLESGRRLSMVTDSLFTPTLVDDIAESLKHLLTHFSPEIYHVVGSQSLSPYEAALLIARQWGLNEKLVGKTTFAEFSKNRAPRPRSSQVISKKNTFHPMRSFEEGLSLITHRKKSSISV